ncbi:Rz1-like lysis system protein LysC [Pasteurella sp. PK-2025]|uniref:Rz1-like lysis system protein LysC n=1 Tax=Pasteurella sp. PK-2025 TaxID=3413133 RepID=UPI003C713CBC
MCVACSTNDTATAVKVICPKTTECRAESLNIKTNSNLARALEHALNRVEMCVIAYENTHECINDFNNKAETKGK